MCALSRLGVSGLSLCLALVAKSDETRRFFDFTPVSSENPVVARIDDNIEIPLSELRAYRDTERIQTIIDPASFAQKHALLQDLIDEYLCVDEAYRTGVTQSAGFLKQMEATRTMVLTDFFALRAAAEKNSAPPVHENTDAAAVMADRLFEAASIVISNEGYELLKTGARLVDTASAASRRGPMVDPPEEAAAKLHAIVNRTPDAVLVRYEHKSISVRQLLAIYAGLPAPRPRLHEPDGLIAMIKPRIVPVLMAMEAEKQGIAADPAFQAKLAQNRNALLRFHMQGVIEREANELLQASDLEAQLHAWYAQHKTEYAPLPENAAVIVIPTYEQARARVLADYSVAVIERLRSEKAAALRKIRAITIDEAVLERL
jgi:hypothetical protein